MALIVEQSKSLQEQKKKRKVLPIKEKSVSTVKKGKSTFTFLIN